MQHPIRARMRRLRRMLNDWDFLGVAELSAHDDEYDCLLGPLLTRLGAGADVEEVAKFLRGKIDGHFGMDSNEGRRRGLRRHGGGLVAERTVAAGPVTDSPYCPLEAGHQDRSPTFVAERIRTMLTAVRLPAVRPTDANQAGAGQRLINASEGVAVERGRDDLVTLSAEEANAYGLLDTVIGS